MTQDELRQEVAIMQQHAEQCRAEAFAMMFGAGEEYTEKLMDVITETAKSENPSKRLFGLLAEIGVCQVLAEISQTADELGEDEP
jgi:hypothetical protein